MPCSVATDQGLKFKTVFSGLSVPLLRVIMLVWDDGRMIGNTVHEKNSDPFCPNILG